jgi:hyperosmotically inducible periplasmic protein
MNRCLARIGALALALAVAPLAVEAATKDAWITTKAKLALLTADDVSVTSVHVDTVNGNVTLHGKVKTDVEKARAEAAVKKLDGVKSVKNLLQVVPDAFKESTKVADAFIKDKVEAALKADASLSGIKVASVNNGVVLLSGKTDSFDRKLRAVEAARNIAGVQRVASEIQVEEKVEQQ